MAIIEVLHLCKSYGTLKAVDDVSFSVDRGETFGILGPNGAGKTTLLEMVEGLRSVDAGEARVAGLDVKGSADKVKEIIGIQLQTAEFFDYLNLSELLALFGSFYAKSLDPEELLRQVDLSEKSKSFAKTLSGGQKQRFSIASALVNDPEIVFLDEPTTGLDPQARHHLWDFVRSIKEKGKTVVLTTHYMEEAEVLCDRVAIMDQGKIIALDTPMALIRDLGATSTIQFGTTAGLNQNELSALAAVEKTDKENHTYALHTCDVQQTLHALLELAENSKANLLDLRATQATLEDVFLHLTGRSLRE